MKYRCEGRNVVAALIIAIPSVIGCANATSLSLRCTGIFHYMSSGFGANSYEKTFFVQILGDGTMMFSGDPKFQPLVGVVVATSRSYTLEFLDENAREANLVYVIDRITGNFSGSSLFSDNKGNYMYMKADGVCVADNSVQKF